MVESWDKRTLDELQRRASIQKRSTLHYSAGEKFFDEVCLYVRDHAQEWSSIDTGTFRIITNESSNITHLIFTQENLAYPFLVACITSNHWATQLQDRSFSFEVVNRSNQTDRLGSGQFALPYPNGKNDDGMETETFRVDFKKHMDALDFSKYFAIEEG